MSPAFNNSFLAGLSPDSRDALVSRSIPVELPLHAVLYEAATTPRYAWFLASGLASIVTPMPNGEMAEVGFIGREGVVGSLQLLGPAYVSTRCMMQLAGSGLRIPFHVLQKAFEGREEIRRRLLHFVQQQAVVVGQIAGCNRLHSAEQRLVRWLLMAQDQTGSDALKLTQEYLAAMIGTQRTTVTALAGMLQERGLIGYTRGNIQILSRPGLEALVCACYPIIHGLHSNLYRRDATPSHSGPIASPHSPSLPSAAPPQPALPPKLSL